MALFRVDFSGRGELAERQQKLAQMLSRLQKISEGLNQECAEGPICKIPSANNVNWRAQGICAKCNIPICQLIMVVSNVHEVKSI